ncbi:hypothetical protein COCCADRAFT_83074, partial [Bipolaris zeicola 26-R-13]
YSSTPHNPTPLPTYRGPPPSLDCALPLSPVTPSRRPAVPLVDGSTASVHKRPPAALWLALRSRLVQLAPPHSSCQRWPPPLQHRPNPAYTRRRIEASRVHSSHCRQSRTIRTGSIRRRCLSPSASPYPHCNTLALSRASPLLELIPLPHIPLAGTNLRFSFENNYPGFW